MTDLLEYIYSRLDCTYLSDLPNPMYREAIIEIMEHIPENEYNLKQWNNVMHYLTHHSISFSSPGEAICYLKKTD